MLFNGILVSVNGKIEEEKGDQENQNQANLAVENEEQEKIGSILRQNEASATDFASKNSKDFDASNGLISQRILLPTKIIIKEGKNVVKK